MEIESTTFGTTQAPVTTQLGFSNFQLHNQSPNGQNLAFSGLVEEKQGTGSFPLNSQNTEEEEDDGEFEPDLCEEVDDEEFEVDDPEEIYEEFKEVSNGFNVNLDEYMKVRDNL